MDRRKLREAYELMLLSRRFDEACERLVAAGQFVPHFHSGTGQEATSIGSVLPLRRDDYLLYTHRGYGALLAKGMSLETIVSDMYFTVAGTNRGFGNVMHLYDPELGIRGRGGVFGSRFGQAAGLALASKLRENGRVALCLYGEAAGARGPLYEALNLAVVWKLPVVYVAENNGFSVGSRTRDLFACGDMSGVWRGLPIPVTKVDGNDIEAVYEVVSTAVDRARKGEGPSIVEALTYRLGRHIPLDRHDGIYRSQDEVAEAWKREPLGRTRDRLVSAGGLPEQEEQALEETVRAEVEKAFESARQAGSADPGEVYQFVYRNKEVAR